MKKNITLREKVRIISFSVAVFIVLLVFAISGYSLATKYKRDIEYNYSRALGELSDHVSNIETTLNKGIYANTKVQQTGLSSKLLGQSIAAKAALEQLPVSYEGLDNVNRFISHIGDFASYLSGNASRDQTATEEEMGNLKKLGEYARSVNSDIKSLIEKIGTGKIGDEQPENTYSNLSQKTQTNEKSVVYTGFKEMNEGFTDYPTLIYDGPFSDHITRMKSKFLEDMPEVSEKEAQQRAANFLGVGLSEIEYVTDSNGNMPIYKFKSGEKEISVTKNGGYVDYLIASRNVESENLDFNSAKIKSMEFMAKTGIHDIKESYYIINNGVCTINYAVMQNNVICYPDLVKIGVALDNGEIVSFDATGYLMNHTERDLPTKIMSKEKAQKSLSRRLTVEDSNLVVIPTAGLKEKLCYEFECTGENDDKVLVYINAHDGLEEQIFIVIKEENGFLVM